MINPLSMQSMGMLSSVGKKAIIIASIGWLTIGENPVTPPPIFAGDNGISCGVKHKEDKAPEQELRERILREDDEILAVIKAFLIVQNNTT